MIDRRGGARFLKEASLRVGVAHESRREELERHQAAKPEVLGLVDYAHAAGADFGDDAIVGDGLADLQGFTRTESYTCAGRSVGAPERFFFYDGEPTSKHGQELGSVFQRVFATAKPADKGGLPHRFRDTFAVSLLLKGVSIEIVSKLLGHCSIKVTERHDSPWVKARQDQLEAEVRRIWATADSSL